MDHHSSLNRSIEATAQPAPSIAHVGHQHPSLFIVLNAGSGKKNLDSVRSELATLFQRANQPYELLICRQPRDLTDLTKQAVAKARQQKGVVVAAGGDGTIRFVAQEVLAADLPFGVLPMGTFNYFARDNKLPQDAVAAAEMLIAGLREGIERPIQVGLLNDQVFLVNASLGLYPQLLADREKFKQQHGRSRIVARLAGIISLLRRETRMQLRVQYASGQQRGEHVVPASTIFVGNNALQLQRVGLETEAESLEHGEIAVVALPPLTALERIGVALRGMFGLLGEASNVTHFACQQLIVEPLSRHLQYVKVAMDGEGARMQSPLIFRVAPKPLRLVAGPSAETPPAESPTTGISA
jgi:diacylglycerol kinase family enzyme